MLKLAFNLNMPLKIFIYVKGLLAVSETATCTALSRVVRRSHDSLTRILTDCKLEWQTLLSSVIRKILGKLSEGYLMIDDTVINKSFAKVIANMSWVFCSKEGRSVLGLNIVVLAWSNGALTIPLAIKIWKEGGPSKYVLALQLLSYARHILKIKPKYVAFDSWYSSKKILQRIHNYGWTFYTQLKKNRKFNGQQVRWHKQNPYWMEVGTIDGDFKILIVRHGKKYFVTNDRTVSKQTLLSNYRTRWNIETMFRILYNQLGFEQCQAQSLTAQNAHWHLCLIAYVVLEQAHILKQQTNYSLRRTYRFQPELVDNLFRELNLVGA